MGNNVVKKNFEASDFVNHYYEDDESYMIPFNPPYNKIVTGFVGEWTNCLYLYFKHDIESPILIFEVDNEYGYIDIDRELSDDERAIIKNIVGQI